MKHSWTVFRSKQIRSRKKSVVVFSTTVHTIKWMKMFVSLIYKHAAAMQSALTLPYAVEHRPVHFSLFLLRAELLVFFACAIISPCSLQFCLLRASQKQKSVLAYIPNLTRVCLSSETNHELFEQVLIQFLRNFNLSSSAHCSKQLSSIFFSQRDRKIVSDFPGKFVLHTQNADAYLVRCISWMSPCIFIFIDENI